MLQRDRQKNLQEIYDKNGPDMEEIPRRSCLVHVSAGDVHPDGWKFVCMNLFDIPGDDEIDVCM